MIDDDLVLQIERGEVQRDEDKPIRVYHCSKCGERGHSSRSCGRKPVRR